MYGPAYAMVASVWPISPVLFSLSSLLPFQLVYDDQLKANCFVRLMEYVCNSVQDKK